MKTVNWMKSVMIEYWDGKTQVIVDRDIIYQIDGLLAVMSADERNKIVKMLAKEEYSDANN